MGDVAGGNWSRDELQLLIKAVNLYPAGTSRRCGQGHVNELLIVNCNYCIGGK